MGLRRHESPEEAYQRGHQEGYDEGYVQGRLAKAREQRADVRKPTPGVLRPVMDETADQAMVDAYGVQLHAPVRVVRDMQGNTMGVFQTGAPPDPDDPALD